MEIAAQAQAVEDLSSLGVFDRHIPRMRVLVAALGVPIVLDAVAYGIGSDLAAWWAPWSLFGAVGFIWGGRVGRAWALGMACLALVVGPAPLAGVVAGAATGELAARGLRVGVALFAALPAAIVATAVLATAWG